MCFEEAGCGMRGNVGRVRFSLHVTSCSMQLICDAITRPVKCVGVRGCNCKKKVMC
jgi:hypothetical protein